MYSLAHRTAIPLIVVAAAASALATGSASAQSWPASPVRMIVPFTVGGASDTAGRIIGQQLGERWSQKVFVENRPGAGGTIGTEVAARAKADGYTLLLGSSTELAVNPNLYAKLNYDTLRDFAPIGLIASTPMVFVVHPSLPAKTVADLVRLARARPGELIYASSGNGASTHLAAEMFKRAAQVDLLHLPHTGAAPAVVSIMNGQAQAGLHAVPAVLGQVRSGKLRALAVTSAKPMSLVPDVPTLVQSGYPSMDVVIWNGLLAPTGTSAEVLSRIESDLLVVLKDPQVQKSFANQGAELTPGDGRLLGQLIRSELARFGQVIQQAKIRLD
ncbi:MAG: Bug family tripartite tricarboxylate transporter substrate binding protein [bacterium]